MTVQQLIAELQKMPQDLPAVVIGVGMDGDDNEEADYVQVEYNTLFKSSYDGPCVVLNAQNRPR